MTKVSKTLPEAWYDHITTISAFAGTQCLIHQQSAKLRSMGGSNAFYKCLIKEKLSTLTEIYDNDEPDPAPHYFDDNLAPPKQYLWMIRGVSHRMSLL